MIVNKFITTSILALATAVYMIAGFSLQAVAFDPFGQVKSNCPQVTDEKGQVIESPVCDKSVNPNPLTGTDGVIMKIANIFALLTGVAAVVAILIGGFEYVRSGGESSKINKAKNTILFAVIGLVVVVVARSLVALLIDAL